jgi:hypothetical protein
VIRLPKPPPSEWPKLPAGARQHADDSEGSASSCDEDEQGEAAGAGCAQPAKKMSSIQRTGLAKASSVVEWLMTALGARKSSKRSGGQDGGAMAGDDDDAAGGCGGEGGVDAAGPKVLVFAHHRGVMNRLAAALEGTGAYAPVSYVRIDGSTDAEDRWGRPCVWCWCWGWGWWLGLVPVLVLVLVLMAGAGAGAEARRQAGLSGGGLSEYGWRVWHLSVLSKGCWPGWVGERKHTVLAMCWTSLTTLLLRLCDRLPDPCPLLVLQAPGREALPLRFQRACCTAVCDRCRCGAGLQRCQRGCVCW